MNTEKQTIKSFAVRIAMGTLVENPEPRTTRTVRTRRNRPYKLSWLEIQRTLHISGERENYLFVENSAGYWLLGTLPFTWSFPDLLWRFGLLGTLRFLFAIFAHFAVKITTDTPFKFHEPRTTRTVRTRASSSFTAFGSHPGGEGKPSPWTLPRTALNLQGTLHFLRFEAIRDASFFVRGFRAFRGENYSGHSLLET